MNEMSGKRVQLLCVVVLRIEAIFLASLPSPDLQASIHRLYRLTDDPRLQAAAAATFN